MNIAKWKDVWRRFSGRGTYPHEAAAILLLPLRRVVLSPQKLIAHLNLRPATPNVGYTQATAAQLPFRSRTFDVAFWLPCSAKSRIPRRA